ncbi:Asp23/Gls24 family envelope stress response protein [Spirillospora sp. NPDC047279]|uniref:Asp23/Gls24 family envelope stress response protein n=1 Tax=Spirillospora sp. NPDC047279 TaxID=3155478 RepID=UPI0033DFE29A
MPRQPATETSGSTSGGLSKAKPEGLASDNGRTSIADGVVAKIAGMAAREIGGVYAMGAGMGRTMGAMREHIPGMGKSVAQGVAVEVGERQAAVDIDLVVEYGVAIPALAQAVRDNVIRSVERMCGLDVVEVNIAVDDIHLPDDDQNDDDADADREPRVQ